MSETPATAPRQVKITETGDCTRLRLVGPISRGTVLVGLVRDAAKAADDDPLLFAHSIFWESREICRAFLSLGFDVDVIDFEAPMPRSAARYVATLTLHHHLVALKPALPANAINIMWLTGSHPEVQNARERQRIQALEARRDCVYQPKRQIPKAAVEVVALDMADHCALIGNQVTLATYPRHLQAKAELFCVSAANIGHIKSASMFVPEPREFVWFAASGAVLKGLDLLLELFSAKELPTLHIVGLLDQEEDFLNIYHAELDNHPRIRRYGFLRGSDPKLAAIFDRCVAVIYPSASESMSAAVAHCLQVGLYPIISRATGIDLPSGCGRYLEQCSIEEIDAAVTDVLQKSDADLRSEIATLQAMALERFSREAFRARLLEVFARWLA
ncbi:MAG: glycosyltransferase [Proteobacteria bacterium]|nr:glycosyltransferase [Pseudomonadota bacterium]